MILASLCVVWHELRRQFRLLHQDALGNFALNRVNVQLRIEAMVRGHGTVAEVSQLRNFQPARDAAGDGQARGERQDHQVAELEVRAAVLEALRACGQPLLYGIADQYDVVAAEHALDRTDSAERARKAAKRSS